MNSIVLLLSVLLAVAVAYCPNGCSGHGECGPNDKCKCYNRINGEPAWTEADCSHEHVQHLQHG